MYGAVGIRPEGIVAGEVDDVGGDCHDEGGREAAPEGCGTLVAGDFAEAIEGGVEGFTPGFVDGTVCCGSGRGRERRIECRYGSGGGEVHGIGGHAEGRGIVHPKDFAAAGRNS